ncbi:MAG TPA: hypothetical protein VM367_00655 [Pseudonocardia sp.]|nr:hypothetical protein [Pseudonocardia sp.]
MLRSEHRQPGQVPRPQARPAVQDPTPANRHGAAAETGTEQRTRDRGDGVGVSPTAHGGDEPVLQAARAADSCPRPLQRGDDPAVTAGEPARGRLLRVIEQLRPLRPDELQPDSDVELAGPDRVVDGQAPQDTRITGLGIMVGQGADGTGGSNDRRRVADVGERDGTGAHQGPVARTATGARVHRRGPIPQPPGRTRARPSTGQHRARLVPDVRGPGGVPAQEAVGDPVEHVVVAQIGTVRSDLRDHAGHLRVVAPLAGA